MKLKKKIQQRYQLTDERFLQITTKYDIDKIILVLNNSNDRDKIENFNKFFFYIHKKKFVDVIFETYI